MPPGALLVLGTLRLHGPAAVAAAKAAGEDHEEKQRQSDGPPKDEAQNHQGNAERAAHAFGMPEGRHRPGRA